MEQVIQTLGRLIETLPEARLSGPAETPVAGLAYDSRKVQKGFLFIAIRGEVTDGNLFVEPALRAGAAAVVSERPVPAAFSGPWVQVADARQALASISIRFFGDPSGRLQLAGVTGTKGKTTTSYLIDSVFRAAGDTSCMMGTVEYRMGSRSWQAERTTPEAGDIQEMLQRALREGCTRAVMEVSSHSLVLHRVRGMAFHTACFTNLSRDHLDFHGDMESYFRAKSMLFEGGEIRGPERAVCNLDDPWGERLSREISGPRLTFGTRPEADVRPRQLPERMDSLAFEACTPKGSLEVRSALAGAGNLSNILAAIAVCQSMDLSAEAIQQGISGLRGVPGRLELIRCGQPFTVIVDYAHTEAALDNLLRLAQGLHPPGIITVVGCGGNRDRTKRPGMGRIAAAGSRLLIVTSDNPRQEDPVRIAEEIEAGLGGIDVEYRRQLDRRRAMAEAFQAARPGEVVLIAGKGHETYQEFAGGKVAFDDRQVARELLEEMRKGSG